jgi:hypothetical protein
MAIKRNKTMSYTRRDSKDPMPTASNSQRAGKDGGGNTPYPAGAEKHDQAKASKISADQNRSTGATAMAVDQPTRQRGDGNVPVTGESHDQKKASKVSESARW